MPAQVADVIADVVRNHRRVAQVVFRDTGLDLPTRSAPTSAAFV
jgi:hypothetical protein